MPILEKVCISLYLGISDWYLGIFQMTPTATTTTRRQFFHLARALAHSGQGWNIPFGNPSLRSALRQGATYTGIDFQKTRSEQGTQKWILAFKIHCSRTIIIDPSLVSPFGCIGRSEGFPNGIFHPCGLWARGSGQLEKLSARRRRRRRRRRQLVSPGGYRPPDPHPAWLARGRVFRMLGPIPECLVLQYFQIHRSYQNAWSFNISRFTGPQNAWSSDAQKYKFRHPTQAI